MKKLLISLGVISILSSAGVVAYEDQKISVPSDSKATYIEIKSSKLKQMAYLSTMRQSSMFGKSASLTFFNCDTKTYKLVVDEDLNSQSGVDSFVASNNRELQVDNMSRHFLTANDPVVSGSITYYKMKHACK